MYNETMIEKYRIEDPYGIEERVMEEKLKPGDKCPSGDGGTILAVSGGHGSCSSANCGQFSQEHKTLLPEFAQRLREDLQKAPSKVVYVSQQEGEALLKALETEKRKVERLGKAAKEMRWFLNHPNEYPVMSAQERWDEALKELEE